MDFDESLVRHLPGNAGILRLFQWKPWAISLGRNQRLEELDVDRCMKDHVDIVHRPTGGRAILHAGELTYSVVMKGEGRSIHQVYHDISRALLQGLSLFGVDAELARSQPSNVNRFPAPCFASSARYEVEWEGRKLVGSAQRRYGESDIVLQHGSILCGPEHKKVVDYMHFPESAARKRVIRSLNENTVDLAEILGHSVPISDLATCILKGFERAWGISFVPHDDRQLIEIPYAQT